MTLTALVALTLAAGAEGPATRVATFGGIELRVPADWRESPQERTVRFEPATGPGFRFLLTVLPVAPGRTPNARRMAEEGGNRLTPTSVEGKLTIDELRGPESEGYYYSFTDKSLGNAPPPAGEYKYLTQGVLGVGGRLVSFTFLSNTRDDPARAAVLGALKGARPTTDLTGRAH